MNSFLTAERFSLPLHASIFSFVRRQAPIDSCAVEVLLEPCLTRVSHPPLFSSAFNREKSIYSAQTLNLVFLKGDHSGRAHHYHPPRHYYRNHLSLLIANVVLCCRMCIGWAPFLHAPVSQLSLSSPLFAHHSFIYCSIFASFRSGALCCHSASAMCVCSLHWNGCTLAFTRSATDHCIDMMATSSTTLSFPCL